MALTVARFLVGVLGSSCSWRRANLRSLYRVLPSCLNSGVFDGFLEGVRLRVGVSKVRCASNSMCLRFGAWEETVL